MRLLIDEDSQGNLLVRLLRESGHDIETVTQAEMAGSDDAAVLNYARQTKRVLLTRNGKDFLVLRQTDHQHPGILIEHQEANSEKNMTYAQIVTAIKNIEHSGWNLQGEFVSINAWR